MAARNGCVSDDPNTEKSSGMRAGRQDRQLVAQREPTPPRPPGHKALVAARDWFEGSVAQGFIGELKALDSSNQAMLFGAGLLVSLLPFLILLSAFASAASTTTSPCAWAWTAGLQGLSPTCSRPRWPR
jgi:hypothetical protein